MAQNSIPHGHAPVKKWAIWALELKNRQVILSYSWQKPSGESGRLDYPVNLETTSCHYGGVRYWFICPAVTCGKRVAKLYLGDKYFAYRLTYNSQRETKGDRGYRGAGKVRERLGWMPGIAPHPVVSPKACTGGLIIV